MIELIDAMNIAKKHYFEKGQQTITKIYETNNMWIVYGGKNGQPKIGNSAITINKETGSIGRFILPSKENFEILKNATLIEYKEE